MDTGLKDESSSKLHLDHDFNLEKSWSLIEIVQ